jgi:hypothetical protein
VRAQTTISRSCAPKEEPQTSKRKNRRSTPKGLPDASEDLPLDLAKLFAHARNLTGRKHHLVPASYLQNWVDDKMLRVTEVKSRHSYLSAPENAARETDYYRIEAEGVDPGALPPQLFEALLGLLEGESAQAIRRIIGDDLPALDDNLTFNFSLFLSFQVLRGRAHRESMIATTSNMYRLLLSHWTDDHIRSHLSQLGEESDEEVAAHRRAIDDLVAGKYQVGPHQATLLAEAGELAFDMVPYVLGRKWVVYEGSGNLLTCDEPVVPVGGPPYRRNDAVGLGTAGALLFPLTPKLLLVMFHPLVDVDGVTAYPHLTYEVELTRFDGQLLYVVGTFVSLPPWSAN